MNRYEPYTLPIANSNGPEQEGRLRQVLFERYFEQYQGKLDKREREKGSAQLALIERANRAIQAYFARIDPSVPTIPPEMVHYYGYHFGMDSHWDPREFRIEFREYSDRDRTLHVLIHEMLHALSSVRLATTTDASGQIVTVSSIGAGLSLYEEGRPLGMRFFDINEALTDLVADEITCTISETAQAREIGYMGYLPEVKALRILMAALVKRSEQDERTIFRQITRLYMRTDQEGFRQLITEQLGPETYETLAELDTHPKEWKQYLLNKFFR